MSNNRCNLQVKQEPATPDRSKDEDEISLDNLCKAIDTVVKSDIVSNDGTVLIKQEEESVGGSSDDESVDDDETTRDLEEDTDVSLPKTATKRPYSLISEGPEENVNVKRGKKKKKRSGKKRHNEYFMAVWGFPANFTEAQITTSMMEMFPNAQRFEVLDHGESTLKVAWFKFKDNPQCTAARDVILNGAEAGGQKLSVVKGNSCLRKKVVTGIVMPILRSQNEDVSTSVLGEDDNDETEDLCDKDIWDKDPSGMYGLSIAHLNKIRVKPPLSPWVHISNFSCSALRLKDLLSLAGSVLICNIKMSDKMSKTLVAKAKFSHPIEAAQAVSMFNGISLDGDTLVVAMDPNSYSINDLLPVGVKSLGPGFGINGEPEADIVRKCQRYFQGKNVDINPQLFSVNPDLRCDKSTQTVVQDDMRPFTVIIKELIDKGVRGTDIMNALRRIRIPNKGNNDSHGNLPSRNQDSNVTTTPQLQKTSLSTISSQMKNSSSQNTSHQNTNASSNNLPASATSNNFGEHNNQIKPSLEMNVVRPNTVRDGINRLERPNWSQPGGNVIRAEHNVMASGPNVVQTASNMPGPGNMMASRHNMINSEPNNMRSEYNMMESGPKIEENRNNITNFRPNMDGVRHNMIGAENNNVLGPAGQNERWSRNNMMDSGPNINDGRYRNMMGSGQNMGGPGWSGMEPNMIGPGNNMASGPNMTGPGNNMVPGPNMTGLGNNMMSHGQNLMGFGQNTTGGNFNNMMERNSVSLQPDGSHKILLSIKNLPPSVTLEQLEHKMAACGDVQFVNIVGSGTAFVRFHNEMGARRCIQFYDNSIVDGNRIQVNLA
ncbi:hypothetical protein JYU34_016002 [Plutella xylostella]|uniref:RRM domain-containing protein n=1 Tax=Plutella xylostella TaxID=51655 RepID=A0ABQ7Q578_PLUXY|nr:hypothetical protein JYU34_016002 [Plutella xylostella]